MNSTSSAPGAQKHFVDALRACLPSSVRTLSRELRQAGFRSWIVGGSVRDVLLAVRAGRAPASSADWDFATDARPEQVQAIFRKVIPTGLQHGTVTVMLGKDGFEVTTLRGERGYSDGRRPDEVFFVDDLREDLARRDFTVNAIAYSIEDEELHDPFGGLGDLELGRLRAVGDAAARFGEDGLRVLRGARFCATLGMQLEEATRAAMRPSLGSFRKVSQERVQAEWWKALASSAPSRCFRVQLEEGLLEVTAPELTRDSTVLDATLAALDAAARDPLRRFTLLLVGLLPRDSLDRAAQVDALARRLKLSNAERQRAVHLTKHLTLPDARDAIAVRRWLGSAQREHVEDVLTFQRELPASLGAPADVLAEFDAVARRELASGHALEPRELALSGKDLLSEKLIAPGPELGRALARLFEHVLAFPDDNTRERLLDLARATDG